MKLILNDYGFSSKEILFASLTLTGGALVTRHWDQSNKETGIAKWGHRTIAIIEAVPLLGGVVAIIEIIAAKFLSRGPVPSSGSSGGPSSSSRSIVLNKAEAFPQLEFDTATTLTHDQVRALKIREDMKSDHPKYADSLFHTSPCGDGFVVTRKPIQKPLPQLEFNVPTILTNEQVIALKIRIDTKKSDLPEYADSIFHWFCLSDGAVVTRKHLQPPIDIPPLVGPKKAAENEGVLFSEGLKVRSFTLDLISHLEDLEMGPEELPVGKKILLKEAKDTLIWFLDMGVMKKEAGFTDFLGLMDLLQSKAEPFTPIFQRYVDLVKLQDKLPRHIKKEEGHWDKIRKMVRSGLFNKTMVETAEHAKKIGLHPIPVLPKDQRIVNLYPTIDAINLLTSSHREAGRWLMNQTRVITFREMCQSIKASCEQLRDTILQWDDYCLLAIPKKSQAWMADIAYRYLPQEKMPREILNFSHYSAGKDLYKHITTSGSDHFILFDDSAYSCQQLEGYLSDLNGQFEIKKSPDVPGKTKHIYIIFGSFPEDKYSDRKLIYYEELKRRNIEVHLVSNLLLKNCGSQMKKDDLSSDTQKQIEDLAVIDHPQVATEWKRPDFMSTSMFISQGFIHIHGKGIFGAHNYTSAESLDGVGPITPIKTCYSNLL